MQNLFTQMLTGYANFRNRYAESDTSIMAKLYEKGQEPQIMIVGCCDSRVDPALLLQCNPGEIFVVRNIANIIPPYEVDDSHHGTSAALDFGINILGVKHLVILGHSECGGIRALLKGLPRESHFIQKWMNLVKIDECTHMSVNDYAKLALLKSYENCLTFPWIQSKFIKNQLSIHLWFFDIHEAEILTYFESRKEFIPLSHPLAQNAWMNHGKQSPA